MLETKILLDVDDLGHLAAVAAFGVEGSEDTAKTLACSFCSMLSDLMAPTGMAKTPGEIFGHMLEYAEPTKHDPVRAAETFQQIRAMSFGENGRRWLLPDNQDLLDLIQCSLEIAGILPVED